MKKLLVGIAFICLGFVLGIVYADDRCACSGYYIYQPKLIILGPPNFGESNQIACAGCSLIQVPIFVDVYAVGALLTVSGLISVIKSSRRKKPKLI